MASPPHLGPVVSFQELAQHVQWAEQCPLWHANRKVLADSGTLSMPACPLYLTHK